MIGEKDTIYLSRELKECGGVKGLRILVINPKTVNNISDIDYTDGTVEICNSGVGFILRENMEVVSPSMLLGKLTSIPFAIKKKPWWKFW